MVTIIYVTVEGLNGEALYVDDHLELYGEALTVASVLTLCAGAFYAYGVGRLSYAWFARHNRRYPPRLKDVPDEAWLEDEDDEQEAFACR